MKIPARSMSTPVLLLTLGLILFVPAASADTPAWLRQLTSVSLPAYPNEVDAVILLDEQSTSVNEKGEIKTVYRKALKILKTKGRERGEILVHFDKETKLTFLKAWAIPTDGKDFEVKERDAIELGISDSSLYEDTRYKVLRIPAAEPGNIIGYEYEQRRRPYILEDQWWFQDEIPVRQARYSLSLPDGWAYRAMWRNFPAKDSATPSESQANWDLSDVPALTIEPAMPSRRAVSGRLIVTLYPSKDSLRGKSHRTWGDVGAWYSQLTDGRRSVTPEIRQKAADLTAGATSPLAKLQALAAFAQRDIRYVSIQIGIGGHQPHEAQAILSNRYGDCKDKVTLLSAMLDSIGVESHYVLIHTRRGVVAPDAPSALSFNHAILAIRLPKDIDTAGLYATAAYPDLGQILFFDPTDDMTPLGYLPGSLQASRGLLVTKDGGQLVELPLLPATTNRLQRTAKFSLSPAGVLDGEVQESRWGDPAISRRAQFITVQASERPKVIESFLAAFLTGFRLTRAEVDGMDSHDSSLTLRYRFVAENYAKSAGNLLLFRPRVLGGKGDDLLERTDRKYPVEFETASVQTDTYEFTLPVGFVVDELPPPVEADYPFASYKSKVEVNGNVLKYTRTYLVKQVEVPPDKLADLKKFYRQIAADERASAVLKRGFN